MKTGRELIAFSITLLSLATNSLSLVLNDVEPQDFFFFFLAKHYYKIMITKTVYMIVNQANITSFPDCCCLFVRVMIIAIIIIVIIIIIIVLYNTIQFYGLLEYRSLPSLLSSSSSSRGGV